MSFLNLILFIFLTSFSNGSEAEMVYREKYDSAIVTCGENFLGKLYYLNILYDLNNLTVIVKGTNNKNKNVIFACRTLKIEEAVEYKYRGNLCDRLPIC